MEDYGSTNDVCFLLTCDMYRHHRDVIKPISKRWWTTTAFSASNDFSVMNVLPDGTLAPEGAHYPLGGVRPACYIKSCTQLSPDYTFNFDIKVVGHKQVAIQANSYDEAKVSAEIMYINCGELENLEFTIVE